MDPRSAELSLLLYYAFGCNPDTCATVQITRRTWHSLCLYLLSLTPPSNLVPIGSGSSFEGTSLVIGTGQADCIGKSDIDIMQEVKDKPVYPIGYLGNFNHHKMKKSEHTRPGFCQVELALKPNTRIIIHEQPVEEVSSNKSVNTYFGNLVKMKEIIGPAATVSEATEHLDYVVCFAGKHWPSECRTWSDKIAWPSISQQHTIRKEGFHIVKKGHPLSPERDQEWRISFSVAEKMLIHSFNPTQLTCAVVMKLLLNHYIKPVVPDSITNYHIKTLILWSVEQDTDQKWEPQYFIQCLQHLLTNLMNCITVGNLQNYFIPDNNLFEGQVTEDNKEMLFEKVEALQLSVADKCISLLHILGVQIYPLQSLTVMLQRDCLSYIAFSLFCESKASLSDHFLRQMLSSMKVIFHDICLKNADMTGSQLYMSMVETIITIRQDLITILDKEGYAGMAAKFILTINTWYSSIIIALCKSKMRNYMLKYEKSNWRTICACSKLFLTEVYENASTTGCIRMALVHMCEGNHYHAVPLLNRSLNIIDQFDNYSLYKEGEAIPTKYNFTEYMHLYNDQKAIESELQYELLNDKVLVEIPFIWQEMNLLPRLLQLEITHSFYNVNILTLLQEPLYNVIPFPCWNPIPLTHFLLFTCHYEQLNSVTFLDPACLQDDIDSLQSLIHDRQRLRQDEVPSVLNLLTWCYLKMKNNKLMARYAAQTVQQSLGCDKTLFSHLLTQHVIYAVVNPDIGSNVPDRKVLVYRGGSSLAYKTLKCDIFKDTIRVKLY